MPAEKSKKQVTTKAKFHKVNKKFTLEQLLDMWVRTRGHFTLNEAVKFLTSFEPEDSEERIARDVRTMISADGLAFTKDDSGTEFYTCHEFFKNKKFIVSRFDLDQKLGVLIPGGRVAPFCHSSILPSEMILRTPEGKKLPKKKIKITIEDAAAYYNLLGAEEMFHYFEADHFDNPAVLKMGDVRGELKLEVYNTALLDHPDAVEFTVQDWSEGIFTVAPAPATALNTPPDWLPDFEHSLYKVFDRFSYYIEIPEQLRQALFLAPEVLQHKDPFETDRLLSCSENIEIILMGSRTLLWRRDEAPPEVKDENNASDDVALSRARTDSIEDILEDLKCPLTPVEIESAMYDELYRGGDNFANVYDRLFAHWELPFADDTQETYFLNYLEALWEDISESYDRVEDHENGRVRHFAIAVNNERLRWLAKITKAGHAPNAKQKKTLESIAERTHLLLRLLETTNLREQFTIPTESDEVIESLTQLADQMNALMQQYDYEAEA